LTCFLCTCIKWTYIYLHVYRYVCMYKLWPLTCSFVKGTFCNEKWCFSYPVVCELNTFIMDLMEFEINTIQYNGKEGSVLNYLLTLFWYIFIPKYVGTFLYLLLFFWKFFTLKICLYCLMCAVVLWRKKTICTKILDIRCQPKEASYNTLFTYLPRYCRKAMIAFVFNDNSWRQKKIYIWETRT
jgi:hypothetical protein